MIMMLHSSRNESARLVSGDLVAGERTGAGEDNSRLLTDCRRYCLVRGSKR